MTRLVLGMQGVWMDRVEGAVGRRKAHTFRGVEEKRRIVEETFRDGASVSSVARAHGVNANQVFQWRRLYRDGLLDAVPSWNETRLLPVAVPDEPRGRAAAPLPTELLEERASAGSSGGVIELTFAWGKLRIAGAADAATLRTVLGCLLT
jgi:transposase